MFQEACRLYHLCNCAVGGGPASDRRGRIFGRGCLVSPTHVITATHVVKPLARQTFTRRDGLFGAEIVFADEQYDVALLRATERIETWDNEPVSQFPPLCDRLPEIGMLVGYMGTLHKTNAVTGKSRGYTYFAANYVSFRNDSSWILGGGFGESGFSGSPVFLPNGNLIGVMTGSMTFSADLDNDPGIPQHFPSIAPIKPFVQQIKTALAN